MNKVVSCEAYTPSLIANNLNKANGRTPCKRKTSTSETQIERERLFWTVIRAYRRRKQTQPLVSSNPDPTGRRTNRTAEDSDFVKHVESATRFALQGTGLFPEWQRLAKDDVWQAQGVMRQVIGRCAREYQERGLAPDSYFSPSEGPAPRSVVRRPRRARALCKQHDLQAVKGCFNDTAGKIVLLECGCERRDDIEAAIPVRGIVVSIDSVRATASRSTLDDALMPELIGAAV